MIICAARTYFGRASTFRVSTWLEFASVFTKKLFFFPPLPIPSRSRLTAVSLDVHLRMTSLSA